MKSENSDHLTGEQASSIIEDHVTQATSAPLPKGGGSIRGIGEKFTTNPVTGTSSITIPIYTTPSRAEFTPELHLDYDSGHGNGPFGFGWSLSIPYITRKTDNGIPLYQDEQNADVLILSNGGDLVPELHEDGTRKVLSRDWHGVQYTIMCYRTRIENDYFRIERWLDEGKENGKSHWRVTNRANVTRVYGDTEESKIYDPDDDQLEYRWLLTKTFDDKGNLIVYDYKPEDGENLRQELHERNRKNEANRYIKRISYGFQTPYVPLEDASIPADWHFQIVFDYGEHDQDNPQTTEDSLWSHRPDSFSTYRSGFEIRTLRRCRRVMMFHQFAELGPQPCLVRSTDFTYADETDSVQHTSLIASLITSVTQTGYIKRGSRYERKSWPPIELNYSQAKIDHTVHTLEDTGLDRLPEGHLMKHQQWIDLDGEGLSGVLNEHAQGWYYTRNAPRYGDILDTPKPAFLPTEQVATKPIGKGLSNDTLQFLDITGEGQTCLVDYRGSTVGYYERSLDGEWTPFQPFSSAPNIDWSDANLRLIDLSGDGRADILLTEHDVLKWHPSLAREGYGPAETTKQETDEEDGATLVFADGTQSVYLADMSGDGMNDLVRIRNGEICYWPNLGYGRFGAKITMSHAPYFDHPEMFDQSRIRLADIDGSGMIDIAYIGRDVIRLYFNHSGNHWSSAVELKQYPVPDHPENITFIDLLGNGTACLVGASSLPSEDHRPLWYIDLMGGTKPYLLTHYKNNMGAETRIHYAPSTKFYVQDRLNGKPWLTKLPFPVHVVEQVERFDHISQKKRVTRYTYHHGYYDGVEREFQGFGKVQTWDTESFSRYAGTGLFTEWPSTAGESFHLPSVRTVSWYHTGAFIEGEDISHDYEDEYDQGDTQAKSLSASTLPEALSSVEQREACRALKGALLREEIYAEDDTEQTAHPYTITQHRYQVKKIQPLFENHHAVFTVHEREALTYQYDRNPADPRIKQNMTLEIDAFGSVTRDVSVYYPRRQGEETQEEQQKLTVILNENWIVNQPEEPHWYRLGIPVEHRTYEVTGILPEGELFELEELKEALSTCSEIPFEQEGSGAIPQKRLLNHVRTKYRSNDLSGPLALGEVESLALPFKSYRLAFTQGLLHKVYGSKVNAELMQEAGYMHSEGDLNWWVPSKSIFYSHDEQDRPSEELNLAKQNFFLPCRIDTPLGESTKLYYDDYALLVTQVSNPIGHTSTIRNHYRVMLPQEINDPNHNRSAVRFDALGNVTLTFVMGKAGQNEGDTFDDTSNEASVIDQPSSRLEYDLDQWYNHQQPPSVRSYSREQYGTSQTRWQESRIYYDGSGEVILTKIQAEPGLAPSRDEEGELERDTNGDLIYRHTDQRWVGTGRTVYDNKGNPVKQYEPYFDCVPDFHDEEELVEYGVTPIIQYDPLGRKIRIDYPDGTWTKTTFDPWKKMSWDANDTVLESKWYEDRGRPDPAEPKPIDPEQRAAWLSSTHAHTPTVIHLDSLGRTFLTVEDNGASQFYETRVMRDLQNNVREVMDALGRKVKTYDFNILGDRIHTSSMESGERWVLNDIVGNRIRRWDSRGQMFSMKYDAVSRLTHLFVEKGGNSKRLIERRYYGEEHHDSDLNLKGKLYMLFDGAGVVINESFDFKGNLLQSSRQLTKEYQEGINWSALTDITSGQQALSTVQIQLEEEVYSSKTAYDALNRPIMVTTPHNLTEQGSKVLPNIIQPTYNEANYIKKVDVWFQQVTVPEEPNDQTTANLHAITDIGYNAKGQRVFVEYGNNVRTAYTYHPFTHKLKRLKTVRSGFSTSEQVVQDLAYTYDPVGNITHIEDQADLQNVIYFNNQRVEPSAEYVYDALYRLKSATGREHIGQTNGQLQSPQPYDFADALRMRHPNPSDGQAMGRYTESYEYDAVGNLLKMIHQTASGRWTRHYAYEESSMNESGQVSNQLSMTSQPQDVASGPYSDHYEYDAHGNMLSMPHLSLMKWDERGNLKATAKQVVTNGGTPETTYYVYDASGTRVRKVTERQASEGNMPTKKEERIYLGHFEIYRKYGSDGTTTTLERESLHIMDESRKIALIETKTWDSSTPGQPFETFIRYQYENHIGSASLELDEHAQLISYEEYTPFGSTSYQSHDAMYPTKRYRYIGKERDEESGLSYHGARYYAPWLGRWISCDPIGLAAGINVYVYASNNPVIRVDLNGKEDERLENDYENVGEVPHDTTAENIRERAREQGIVYSEDEEAVLKDNTWYLPPSARWINSDAEQTDEGEGGSTESAANGSDDSNNTTEQEGREQEPTGEITDDSADITGEGGVGTDDSSSEDDSINLPTVSGANAVNTWDSIQRGRYIAQNEKNAKQAVQKIGELRKRSGRMDELNAITEAHDAFEKRNDNRSKTQKRISPGGRKLSEHIDRKWTFDEIVRKEARPNQNGFDLAENIAKSSGRSNKSFKHITRFSRVAGPVGVAYGIYSSGKAVYHAQPGRGWQVFTEEAVGWIASGIGYTAGMALGVALLGGTLAGLPLILAAGAMGLLVAFLFSAIAQGGLRRLW